jgi:V/A-type H+-transporting ATPase subunit I
MKMRAITISGQISEFDSVVEKYIYGREIHLEKAMSVLSNKKNLYNFEDNNEYDVLAKNALSILKLANYKVNSGIAPETATLEEMKSFLNNINSQIESEKQQSEKLDRLIKANDLAIANLDLMLSADVDLAKIINFEFIKFQFGHIPKTGYKTLVTYLDNLEVIFVKTAEDLTDVWGFYFVPVSKEKKIDEIFSSLYFEAVNIPENYTGTPREIQQRLIAENEKYQNEIDELSKKTAQMLSDSVEELCRIYNLAKKRHQFAEVRRNAVHSDVFFYIVGWMEEKDAEKLEKEIANSGDIIMFYSGHPSDVKDLQPPTKLKNNPVFKPFEMFVKMYGLPSYGEIDPTPILAITYILFFGIMFGDVGQAAILSIAGFILYRIKKWDLGGIVGIVGISGMVFGFIYGSFFGNEEIIPELFHTTPIQPMSQITLMLGGTIAMGVLIIIFGMVLNVINSVRSKNKGEALFGHNGIAGLVFYINVLLLAGNIFLKWGVPNFVFITLIVIAVLAMYLCEPLSKLVSGKKNWLPKDGMFFVENLFEMFEVILSFFTNTISFLRIGAFAIVHVGMMMVVAILSQGGGIGGVIVQILGNVLVMVLEGLIVGIQVLRLEYYEMFSRYFSGRGKEFVSISDK